MKTIKLETMKTIKLLAILFISSIAFVGCSDDDDHEEVHEEHEELITTVRYTLTNANDSDDVVTLTFTDLDGEGGADGTYVVSGPITASATYTGGLELLNEVEDENIGEEIAEGEADEHEIFYINNGGISFAKTDLDGNGNFLGFNTEVTVGEAGNSSLTIAIIHEAKKPNDGTVADALSESGTTDIEVSFDVTVE